MRSPDKPYINKEQFVNCEIMAGELLDLLNKAIAKELAVSFQELLSLFQ